MPTLILMRLIADPRRAMAAMLLSGLMLAGCASPPRVIRETVAPPTVRRYHPATPPSFDCNEASSTVQDTVCATDALSRLDQEMAAIYRQKLRSADSFGREPLIGSQRRWLLGRVAACHVPGERLVADQADPMLVECLARAYRERIAELNAWSFPVKRPGDGSVVHPAAAYVEFKIADDKEPALCGAMAEKFNAAIKRVGEPDPSAIPGMVEIAGTHSAPGRAGASPQITVEQYDAGTFASYAIRATGVTVAGARVLDRESLGQWILEQPNSGGRFGPDSSQTRDYGAVDVFDYSGRQFALVNETWGFYSPAARGESSYAGLYEISSGQADRLCLYKTYLHPPFRGVFERLPALNAWRAVLKQIKESTPLGLDYNERRDDYQLRLEAQWNVLNLPLVALDDAKRNGWSGWLRKRHDLMIDGLFAFSETDVDSKELYREFFSTLRPVSDELIRTFMQTQGLTEVEARDATNLVILEMIYDAAADLPGGGAIIDENPARLSGYKPRYPLALTEADVVRGRKFETAHSAALNGAPSDVVDDLMRYELGNGDHRLVPGAAGESVLTAAVATPATLSFLLSSGLDPKQVDARGRTSLMAAARANQLESAQLLMQAGVDVNAGTLALPFVVDVDKQVMEARAGHRTALMVAAQYARPEMVRLLLAHGARTNDYDTIGRNACQYVERNRVIVTPERDAMKSLLCGEDSRAPSPASYENLALSADRFPAAGVGDRALFVDGVMSIKCNQWEIRQANKNGINIAKCGENAIYTNAENGNPIKAVNDRGDTVIEFTPYYPGLSFPLFAGKKWSGKYEGRQPLAAWSGEVTCEAAARETIQVAAGKFDAFRIECTDKWHAGPMRGSRKGTTWYSPALGTVIKAVSEDSKWNSELAGVGGR